MVSIDASFFYRIIRHRNRFLYEIKGYSLLSFSIFRQLVFIIDEIYKLTFIKYSFLLYWFVQIEIFIFEPNGLAHTRARTYWTEKEKCFCVKWTISNRECTHRAKGRKKNKTMYRFFKKNQNKKKTVLFYTKMRSRKERRQLGSEGLSIHMSSSSSLVCINAHILRFVARLAKQNKRLA